MKKLKQYHTFLNENSSLYKINVDELEKLFNNDTITVDDNPIKIGRNIYEYDLIRLAQGVIVSIKDCNCRIMLEDGIDFKDIRNIVRKSPLNEHGAMFWLFMDTHPMKAS